MLLAGAALALAVPAWAHPRSRRSTLVTDDWSQQPEDPVSYVDLAQTRRLAGNWDGALLALEHAAVHGAKPVEVSALRGAIYFDAGWANMALFEADRALALEPAQPQVQILRARGRAWRSGVPDEAARDARRDRRHEGPDAITCSRCATRCSRPGTARGRWRRSTLIDARRPGAVARAAGTRPRARARTQRGRAARIDALLATNPRNEGWLARRGDVLDRLGRRDEARLARRRTGRDPEQTRQPARLAFGHPRARTSRRARSDNDGPAKAGEDSMIPTRRHLTLGVLLEHCSPRGARRHRP